MPIVYYQKFIVYPTYIHYARTRRKQVGGIIETRTAFFGRYYTSDTYDNGRRKAKTVKLADKSDIYRSKADVNTF